ncbi:MAG: hypothetical protein ABEI54_03220 [Candidatus Bipolaricaulia bacterium]
MPIETKKLDSPEEIANLLKAGIDEFGTESNQVTNLAEKLTVLDRGQIEEALSTYTKLIRVYKQGVSEQVSNQTLETLSCLLEDEISEKLQEENKHPTQKTIEEAFPNWPYVNSREFNQTSDSRELLNETTGKGLWANGLWFPEYNPKQHRDFFFDPLLGVNIGYNLDRANDSLMLSESRHKESQEFESEALIYHFSEKKKWLLESWRFHLASRFLSPNHPIKTSGKIDPSMRHITELFVWGLFNYFGRETFQIKTIDVSFLRQLFADTTDGGFVPTEKFLTRRCYKPSAREGHSYPPFINKFRNGLVHPLYINGILVKVKRECYRLNINDFGVIATGSSPHKSNFSYFQEILDTYFS